MAYVRYIASINRSVELIYSRSLSKHSVRIDWCYRKTKLSFVIYHNDTPKLPLANMQRASVEGTHLHIHNTCAIFGSKKTGIFRSKTTNRSREIFDFFKSNF